ncbi:cytochrome P450 [Laetiporus sulphureus 93-53]|uniref:Cytochrome P450 n=1 Tax=Laetiporus sulphureus 93-53 TaxID=1314785 RepID=A0A165GWM4_9APHY|nr:cytochrome P450 [Laetiporus sulphureus 93-53]KZT10926.1 cytochrome P450 [Laetiporus sulphureus 93-53]
MSRVLSLPNDTEMQIETAAYALYKLYVVVFQPQFSSLRSLRGPASPSRIYGNLRQIFDTGSVRMQEMWVEQYGETIKYKGWLNQDYLYTVDPRAINHILTHSQDYHKPALARYMIAEAIGSVVVVEGEQHRKQNPAFGPVQLRNFTEIFVDRAIQLRNMWLDEISDDAQGARLDVLNGLSKMTLDVMGSAGFDHEFDLLRRDGKFNELADAFQAIFGPPSGKPLFLTVLQFLLPPLRYLPTERTRRLAAAKATIYRIGAQLLVEKKRILEATVEGEKAGAMRLNFAGRDLLALLLKANMATGIPVDQRLTDDEVLTPGYETTANGAMWCLYALTQNLETQEKLYAELSEVPTDGPSMDELQALPFLDLVVRETLRLHAPVPSSLRVAVKDDTIPLQKPFVDVHGKPRDRIDVPKGTTIDIPLLALNRAKTIWGDDALEFNDLMTFLGGPRGCIGYRFAIIEIKALILTLVRAFEFKLAIPADEVVVKSTVVRRPIIRSETEKGTQMPMIIRPRRA